MGADRQGGRAACRCGTLGRATVDACAERRPAHARFCGGCCPPQAATDPHVVSAERLVDQLDLANTNYEHGQGSVTWTGTVASHTDCSGFIDHLLMHDDGLAADDFKRWFGSKRPTAERYHDAIVEGRGFTRLGAVDELRAGDLIAIKYLTRHDNTGHIMLVIDAPQRMNAGPAVHRRHDAMVGGGDRQLRVGPRHDRHAAQARRRRP